MTGSYKKESSSHLNTYTIVLGYAQSGEEDKRDQGKAQEQHG